MALGSLLVSIDEQNELVLDFESAHLEIFPLLAQRMSHSIEPLSRVTESALHLIWLANGNIKAGPLAVKLKISAPHLNDTFTREIGCTLRIYRRQYRAELACALYLLTQLSPRDIALCTGAKSSQQMAVLVRDYYPPFDLRRERTLLQTNVSRLRDDRKLFHLRIDGKFRTRGDLVFRAICSG